MRAALRERARSRDTQRCDNESNNHCFQDARHFHKPSSFVFEVDLETRSESRTLRGCFFLASSFESLQFAVQWWDTTVRVLFHILPQKQSDRIRDCFD